MSENLDLVRSIQAHWDRGDFSSVGWAHPDIEFEFADGPDARRWTGLDGMAEGWRVFQSTWEDLRPEATEFREIDGERVLVLIQFSRARQSQRVQLGEMDSRNASVHHLKDGKVVRLALYWDRDRALADLGVKE